MDIARQYLQIGFTHVIPLGFDHILFILSIFFLNSDIKSVIIQCSVFTLAHSVTLGLTAAGYIAPDTAIVEPLIALSIVFAAIENIIHQRINAWRVLVIFVFGLIHGMGFASALKETGIPEAHFAIALLFFNLGVEAGQVTIILCAYFFIAKWFKNKPWYRNRVVYPISSAIACVAIYWTIERIMI